METWYEQLGLSEDPFNELILNQELKEEIQYTIEAGNLLFIEGPEGSGKTTLLKHAIDMFKGNKKVAYIDAQNIKDINIESLLKKRSKLFGKEELPKRMILLLDNVHHLSYKNTERLKFYHDHDYIRSVIFTSTCLKETNLSVSLRERIGNRVISLEKLSEDKVAKTLKQCAIPERVIKEIYHLSDKNVKVLTENLVVFYKEIEPYPIEKVLNMTHNQIKQILEQAKNDNLVSSPGI